MNDDSNNDVYKKLINNKITIPNSLTGLSKMSGNLTGLHAKQAISTIGLSRKALYTVPKIPATTFRNMQKMQRLSSVAYAKNIMTPSIKLINEVFKSTNTANQVLKSTANISKIINNNLSLFAKRLGESLKPIRAIGVLASNQYVYWNYLSSDFIDGIIAAGDIDKFMTSYYSKDNYKLIESEIVEIRRSIISKKIKKVFSQAVSSYRREQYEVAIIGMLVVVDYLLTNCSGETTTSINRRGSAILEKLFHNEDVGAEDYSLLTLAMTFEQMTKSISAHRDFADGDEPNKINRHWTLHGRSSRMAEQIDCIKMINFIYSILLIQKLDEKN